MSLRTNQFAYSAGNILKIWDNADKPKEWRVRFVQKCISICCAIEAEEKSKKRKSTGSIQEMCAFTSLALGVLNECTFPGAVVCIEQVKELFDLLVCQWKFEANNQKLLHHRLADNELVDFFWSRQALYPHQISPPLSWARVKQLSLKEFAPPKSECATPTNSPDEHIIDKLAKSSLKSVEEKVSDKIGVCQQFADDVDYISRLFAKFLELYPHIPKRRVAETLQKLPLNASTCADLRDLVQDIEKENCAATFHLTAFINMWQE